MSSKELMELGSVTTGRAEGYRNAGFQVSTSFILFKTKEMEIILFPCLLGTFFN